MSDTNEEGCIGMYQLQNLKDIHNATFTVEILELVV